MLADNIGSPEQIRDFFSRFVAGWLIKDLDFCASQQEDLSFTVAVVAFSGIECLGSLLAETTKTDERFRAFVTRYFPKEYSKSGFDFYDIYRCGLVHQYFPKKSATITWGTSAEHLVTKNGCHYLNAQALVEDLKLAIDKYRNDLLNDADLRMKFKKRLNEIAPRADAATTVPDVLSLEPAGSSSKEVYKRTL